MTLNQIQAKYGVSVPTLRHWTRIGKLQFTKVKNRPGKFEPCILVDESHFKQVYRKDIPWEVVRNLYDLPEEL